MLFWVWLFVFSKEFASDHIACKESLYSISYNSDKEIKKIHFCRLVHYMRQTAAAIKIQACVRGWVKRVQYRRLVYTVTQLQAYARGTWARQRFEHMRRVRAVSNKGHWCSLPYKNHYISCVMKSVRIFCIKPIFPLPVFHSEEMKAFKWESYPSFMKTFNIMDSLLFRGQMCLTWKLKIYWEASLSSGLYQNIFKSIQVFFGQFCGYTE